MDDEEMNLVLRQQILNEIYSHMKSAAKLFDFLKETDDKATLKEIHASHGKTSVTLNYGDNNLHVFKEYTELFKRLKDR